MAEACGGCSSRGHLAGGAGKQGKTKPLQSQPCFPRGPSSSGRKVWGFKPRTPTPGCVTVDTSPTSLSLPSCTVRLLMTLAAPWGCWDAGEVWGTQLAPHRCTGHSCLSLFIVQLLSSIDGEAETQRGPVSRPRSQSLYLAASSCGFSYFPCTIPNTSRAGPLGGQTGGLLG